MELQLPSTDAPAGSSRTLGKGRLALLGSVSQAWRSWPLALLTAAARSAPRVAVADAVADSVADSVADAVALGTTSNARASICTVGGGATRLDGQASHCGPERMGSPWCIPAQ